MAKIHHNTVKRAARFGVTLTGVDGMVEASVAGRGVLARHSDAKQALATAVSQMGLVEAVKALKKAGKSKPPKKVRRKADATDDEADDEDFAGEGDEDADEGKSIVKRKYKQRYRPFKMTCGDDIASEVSAHVTEHDDVAGAKRINLAKLKRFAQANGVWDAKYAHLNPGMQRMNIVNRLRGKIRRDKYEVRWV